MHDFRFRLAVTAVFLCSILCSAGEVRLADGNLSIVRRYADTMLAKGRDTYGAVSSPLFASALDRNSLSLPKSAPSAPEGVRRGDRTLTGANPMHDENFLRLLYTLTELTGEKRYATAADDSLRFFFNNCRNKTTGFFAWGEHLGWDFNTESVLNGRDIHEYYRPWVLWDRCLELAPETSLQFARGLWEHQIADQKTGNFNRHARFDRHGPERDKEFPRHAGFYTATWAKAYAKTGEAVFVHACEILLDSFERRRESNGRFPGANPRSDLSWAIDIWEAASVMPEPVARRMRSAASKTDIAYLRKFGKGIPTKDGKLWKTAYGDATTAREAMICYERYRQTKSESLAGLIVQAAENYLSEEPDKDITLYPGVYGEVVSLLVAAYRMTAENRYLKRADVLADEAVRIFWSDGPLPRASSRHTHYEAITRADTLALALLELWSIHKRPDRPLVFSWVDR